MVSDVATISEATTTPPAPVAQLQPGEWDQPGQRGTEKSPTSFGRRNFHHALFSSLKPSRVSGPEANDGPATSEDGFITYTDFRS